MPRYLPLIFLLLTFCTSTKQESATNEEIISSLEYILNNPSRSSPEPPESLIDSLLKLDPNNYVGLKSKGINAFNRRDIEQSKMFLQKAVKQDSSQSNMIFYMLGMAYEISDSLEIAKNYYKKSLEGDQAALSWYLPQLKTIIKGKEEGLRSLDELRSEIGDIPYFQTLNDINRYDGGGMNFFFPPFFEQDSTHDFYITIPDTLYDNGKLNSMGKVNYYYASRGINVFVFATDTKNRGFKIMTTDVYVNDLLDHGGFSLKKL